MIHSFMPSSYHLGTLYDILPCISFMTSLYQLGAARYSSVVQCCCTVHTCRTIELFLYRPGARYSSVVQCCGSVMVQSTHVEPLSYFFTGRERDIALWYSVVVQSTHVDPLSCFLPAGSEILLCGTVWYSPHM